MSRIRSSMPTSSFFFASRIVINSLLCVWWSSYSFISWRSILSLFDLLASQLFALGLVGAALGSLFNILSRLADMSSLLRSSLELRWCFLKDCWSFFPCALTKANIPCDAINVAPTSPWSIVHPNMTSVSWPFDPEWNFCSIKTTNPFIFPPSLQGNLEVNDADLPVHRWSRLQICNLYKSPKSFVRSNKESFETLPFPSVSNVDLRDNTCRICQSEYRDPILFTCKVVLPHSPSEVEFLSSRFFSARLLRRMRSVVDRSGCLLPVVPAQVTRRTEQLSRWFHFGFSPLVLRFFRTLERKIHFQLHSLLHGIMAKWNKHKPFLFSRRLCWSTVSVCSCIWSTDWGLCEVVLCSPFHPISSTALSADTHLIGQPICADGRQWEWEWERAKMYIPVRCDGREAVREQCRIVVICSICLTKCYCWSSRNCRWSIFCPFWPMFIHDWIALRMIFSTLVTLIWRAYRRSNHATLIAAQQQTKCFHVSSPRRSLVFTHKSISWPWNRIQSKRSSLLALILSCTPCPFNNSKRNVSIIVWQVSSLIFSIAREENTHIAFSFALSDDLIFRSLCKQITHLRIDVELTDGVEDIFPWQTFALILSSCPTLLELEFAQYIWGFCAVKTRICFLFNTFQSATLTRLKLTVGGFIDCLLLLDGRCESLSTLIIHVEDIYDPLIDIGSKASAHSRSSQCWSSFPFVSRDHCRSWSLSHSPRFLWPNCLKIRLCRWFVEWSISKICDYMWFCPDPMFDAWMLEHYLITCSIICQNSDGSDSTLRPLSRSVPVSRPFQRVTTFEGTSVAERIDQWWPLCTTILWCRGTFVAFIHSRTISIISSIWTIVLVGDHSTKCDSWRCATSTHSKMPCFASFLATCLCSNIWRYRMNMAKRTSSVHRRCSSSLVSNVWICSMPMMIMRNYSFRRRDRVNLVWRASGSAMNYFEKFKPVRTAIQRISISTVYSFVALWNIFLNKAKYRKKERHLNRLPTNASMERIRIGSFASANEKKRRRRERHVDRCSSLDSASHHLSASFENDCPSPCTSIVFSPSSFQIDSVFDQKSKGNIRPKLVNEEMKRSFEDEQTKKEFGQGVAVKCYELFDRLGSRGTASTGDRTHLAAFIALHRQSNEVDVLSIGTGTKSWGKEVKERGTNGCLLHDSHAEVIAERSLQGLFYEMILTKDRSLLDCLDEEKNF